MFSEHQAPVTIYFASTFVDIDSVWLAYHIRVEYLRMNLLVITSLSYIE